MVNGQVETESYFEMPEFSLNLEDLVVTVGHSLTYPVTFTQEGGVADPSADEFTMLLSLNLARISSFAKLDLDTNSLFIDGDMLQDSDAGFYTIDVAATFSDGLHKHILTDKFRLEVRAAPKETDFKDEEEVIVPENIIYISEWTGLIELAKEGSFAFNSE